MALRKRGVPFLFATKRGGTQKGEGSLRKKKGGGVPTLEETMNAEYSDG